MPVGSLVLRQHDTTGDGQIWNKERREIKRKHGESCNIIIIISSSSVTSLAHFCCMCVTIFGYLLIPTVFYFYWQKKDKLFCFLIFCDVVTQRFILNHMWVSLDLQ